MKHELWYSVVVRDRQGKVVSRERRRAKSFLKAWNQVIYAQMFQVNVSIKDTDGADRSVDEDTNNLRIAVSGATTAYGMRVGTGDTAVAIDDYALEAPIAHGTGAGQMSHAGCTVSNYTVAAPSCSFIISRTFTNNSGDSITVKEAGLYMRMDSSYYGCAARDVFSSPQAVPNGGSITINWTLKVTV
ncbi:hypothetical protein ES703_64445 [subsurface metagenome]